MQTLGVRSPPPEAAIRFRVRQSRERSRDRGIPSLSEAVQDVGITWGVRTSWALAAAEAVLAPDGRPHAQPVDRSGRWWFQKPCVDACAHPVQEASVEGDLTAGRSVCGVKSGSQKTEEMV